MKFMLLSALVAVAFSHSVEIAESGIAQWELFKITHEKEYESDMEEEERKQIFLTNLQFIREHNAKFEKGEVSFDVKINKFADMTSQEFAARMNGYNRHVHRERHTQDTPPGTGSAVNDYNVELPRTVDWRTKGAVTGVKDQGTCGSCWAFSTTGSVEAQHYLKTKQLVSLSEQNLMDCSTAEGNEGCHGGWMYWAFDYIKKNNGIDTEQSYPYTASDGKCHYKPKNIGATVTGYVNVTIFNEKALQKAVATVGPVSVAIDAGHKSFQFYSSGVYKEPNCSATKLDHGVLAVGYGTAKKGGAYWLVKNSWGANWGMSGYIMMARNHHNMCGIATAASYPTV